MNVAKHTYFLMCSVFSFVLGLSIPAAQAQQTTVADPHAKHSRIGYHGMVLVSAGDKLFANHLPLYRRPHDYQIVYEIDAGKNHQALQAALEKGTVTLLPEQFDLNILVTGQTPTLTVNFYKGHFERGGEKWLENIAVSFKRQRYLRSLTDLPTSKNGQTAYDFISANSQTGAGLLIHQIQPAPSVDHIIGVQGCQANVQRSHALSFSHLEQQRKASLAAFSTCQNVQELYWETADFAK